MFYDGVLGELTDPLMQQWKRFDESVCTRIFNDEIQPPTAYAQEVQNDYMALRRDLHNIVKRLNHQAFFAVPVRQAGIIMVTPDQTRFMQEGSPTPTGPD